MPSKRRTALALSMAVVTAISTLAHADTAGADELPVAGVVISGLSGEEAIGYPVTATFTSDGEGVTPVAFEYWDNDGPHKTVSAIDGAAAVSITFPASFNYFYVEGIGPDGSIGRYTEQTILAYGLSTPADKDLNSDGLPDLITVDDQAGLSGLWQATGRTNGAAQGKVNTPAVAVAYDTSNPSWYDGAITFTGNFLYHSVTDVFVYKPSDGDGIIESGMGDGSRMISYMDVSGGLLTDINGNNPIDLANAYDSAGSGFTCPDLIGISGSDANGYALTYYPLANDDDFDWVWPDLTTNSTPTGGADWQDWQLASVLLPSGTAMFLWNRSTGDLYLWESLHFTDDGLGDYVGSVSYTQYKIASNWNTGATFTTIEAADFGGDGIPDLWTVTPEGIATAYVLSNLSGTLHIHAKTPQDLR